LKPLVRSQAFQGALGLSAVVNSVLALPALLTLRVTIPALWGQGLFTDSASPDDVALAVAVVLGLAFLVGYWIAALGGRPPRAFWIASAAHNAVLAVVIALELLSGELTVLGVRWGIALLAWLLFMFGVSIYAASFVQGRSVLPWAHVHRA